MMRHRIGLGEQIADWILADIKSGATPFDLGDRLARELGFGVEAFVRASALPGKAMAELIRVQAARTDIAAVWEH
jgi:hypothetical protein